jgi:hypothetical protein
VALRLISGYLAHGLFIPGMELRLEAGGPEGDVSLRFRGSSDDGIGGKDTEGQGSRLEARSPGPATGLVAYPLCDFRQGAPPL